MRARLQDSVIIVTGAAMGQGRAHALRCAAEGARLILADIREDLATTVAEELTGQGHQAQPAALDVRAGDQWARLVEKAISAFGRLDGLVNNAGIMSHDSVLDGTAEQWEDTIATNQTGMLLGMRHCAPAMAANGGGAIVNVASTLAFHASAVGVSYQAGKAAVRAMSKSAALRLADDGVRVNTILPGLVDTPFLGDSAATGALDDSIARIPLGRLARPEEIAPAAAFLISTDASYITGAELVIDGGMTAGSATSLQPHSS